MFELHEMNERDNIGVLWVEIRIWRLGKGDDDKIEMYTANSALFASFGGYDWSVPSEWHVLLHSLLPLLLSSVSAVCF